MWTTQILSSHEEQTRNKYTLCYECYNIKLKSGKKNMARQGHIKHDQEDFSAKGTLEQETGTSETIRLSSLGRVLQAEITWRLELVGDTGELERLASQGRVSTRGVADDVRARGHSRGQTGESLGGCSLDLLLTRSEIGNHRGVWISQHMQGHFGCCEVVGGMGLSKGTSEEPTALIQGEKAVDWIE